MTIIKNDGYSVEHHTVVTEDKYVLGIHRIPAKKEATKTVLVVHGLVNSGVDFVIFGPQYSLGMFQFYLSNINTRILTIGLFISQAIISPTPPTTYGWPTPGGHSSLVNI